MFFYKSKCNYCLKILLVISHFSLCLSLSSLLALLAFLEANTEATAIAKDFAVEIIDRRISPDDINNPLVLYKSKQIET